MTQMTHFFAMTQQELKSWVSAEGEKPYLSAQLSDWVYHKGISDPLAMSNIAKSTREKLASKLQMNSLQLVKKEASSDGETFKFLWRLSDGKLVESVLILSFDRRTVCVSSQVGCPAKCSFCASGKEGLLRDLNAAEIVEQIYWIDRWLQEKDERVSHIVFMGMGEPLKNYEAVTQAIRIITDPQLLGIGQRRITVSTVGVVENIERLAQEDFRVNLVLSLHAPNQHLRKKIIPYARKYELADILKAMDNYAEITKRDITFEYTLLAGINDQVEQAKELAALLRHKQCTVNLIPYNPIPGMLFKRPEKEAIQQFRAILRQGGINHTCRYTKGDDIAAACGQLALEQSNLSSTSSSNPPASSSSPLALI